MIERSAHTHFRATMGSIQGLCVWDQLAAITLIKLASRQSDNLGSWGPGDCANCTVVQLCRCSSGPRLKGRSSAPSRRAPGSSMEGSRWQQTSPLPLGRKGHRCILVLTSIGRGGRMFSNIWARVANHSSCSHG